MTHSNPLAPHRLPGESAVEYRERRREIAKSVDRYLKGQLAFISSQPVQLIAKGEDEKVDEAIRQGQFRRVVSAVKDTGESVRVGVTKGKTFRKGKA
jgi:hypothetical protein